MTVVMVLERSMIKSMNEIKGTDMKNHFRASMVKSGIRIAGCYFLMTHQFVMAGVMLAVAEFVGILEEVV